MRKILTATLAAGLLTAGAASAGTATTTFAVTATVNSTCATTATALAFPAYTPGAGAVTQSSTVSVKCTKNTPYTVLLNGGVGGTVAQRAMTSGANTLQYQLYTTVGLATVWGDGTGSSVTRRSPSPPPPCAGLTAATVPVPLVPAGMTTRSATLTSSTIV